MVTNLFNWTLDHFYVGMIGSIVFLLTMYLGATCIEKYHSYVGVDQLNLVDIYRKVLPIVSFFSACAAMLTSHQLGL